MPRVLFDRDYFSVPNKLIDRWAWTELDFVCLAILCNYLRIAFGNFQVVPSQKAIARQLGISDRYVREQHKLMEGKGMLRTIRTIGGKNTIDLNPLKSYIEHLKPPVDNLWITQPDPGTTVPGGVRNHSSGVPVGENQDKDTK
jgi:hypothetical protein